MEWKLFPEGETPEFTTADWYAGRESAPHLEQEPHRSRLLLTAEHVRDARDVYDLDTVVDLGSGDGGLLSLLAPVPSWGYDLQQSNVDASKARGVDVRYGNIIEDPIEWGDAAVATELIEHLLDPHEFVRTVATHCRVLVASSPWTETSESHYAFHTYAWDKEGYRALMEQAGYRVVRHDTVDMFQVLTAVQG